MIAFDISSYVLTKLDKGSYWLHFYRRSKLTPLEARLFLILSNNEENTFREIGNFVYGHYSRRDNRRIRALVHRLKDKYNIEIENKNSVGYKLKEDTYIY
jgi:DNA-binding response OmpR family regulator